jgi:UDP-glucose:(heptosyl)LPS alpha-1,3-glucosyltransferase
VHADRRRVAVVARRITGLSGVTILIREHAIRAVAAGWGVDVYGERIDHRAVSGADATAFDLRPGWFHRSSAAWFAGAAANATRGKYAIVHGHGDALEQDVLSLHNCIHAVHEAIHGVPLDSRAPAAEAARLHERQLRDGRFRRLIANSILMRDDVTKRFAVDPARVVVVYPGFDPRRYHPRPRTDASRLLRRHLRLGDDTVLAGLVTSGDWQKRGIATFIEALAIVNRGGQRVHGIITGKERSASRYLGIARERGIADRIHVLPPAAALENVYGALDVFVYPAQLEEFGMCVQEAMACGLPVVCGRHIGATELLDPPAAAMLLDSVSPGSVADRLAAFVVDENLRRQTGAINAASVARNSWDRSAAGVLAVYDELVA